MTTLILTEREQSVLDELSLRLSLPPASVLRQALRVYQLVDLNAQKGNALAFVDASGALVPRNILGCGADETP